METMSKVLRERSRARGQQAAAALMTALAAVALSEAEEADLGPAVLGALLLVAAVGTLLLARRGVSCGDDGSTLRYPPDAGSSRGRRSFHSASRTSADPALAFAPPRRSQGFTPGSWSLCREPIRSGFRDRARTRSSLHLSRGFRLVVRDSAVATLNPPFHHPESAFWPTAVPERVSQNTGRVDQVEVSPNAGVVLQAEMPVTRRRRGDVHRPLASTVDTLSAVVGLKPWR